MTSSSAVWISNTSGALQNLSVGMIHFLPPLYALELGASPAIVGFIAAGSSLAGLFFALPAGKFVDRLGPRQTARFATLCMSLSILIYLLISAPIWLTIPGFLAGIFGTTTVLSFHSYISRLSRGVERAKGISQFGLFANVGELTGPVLAGAIVDLFSFTVAFFTAAAVCFLSSAAAFCLPRMQETRTAETPQTPGPTHGFRGLLALRGLQAVLWASFSLALIRSFYRAFLPVLLHDTFSATEIGSLFFLASVSALAGRYVVGLLAGRYSLQKLLPIAVVTVAAPTIFIPFLPGYSSIGGAMALFGAGTGLLAILTIVLTVEHAASRERGLALGMRITTMRFGSTMGLLTFGTFAQMTSVVFAFMGVGGLGLIVAVVLVIYRVFYPPVPVR